MGPGRAGSPANGYTILFVVVDSSSEIAGLLRQDPRMTPKRTSSPSPRRAATPNWWQINPDFPAQTMKEPVDLFRKRTRQVQRRLARRRHHAVAVDRDAQARAGLDFVTVPFAGGGPMTTSLLGGHTPIACGAIGNTMALIKDGKMRALAIAAKKRSSACRTCRRWMNSASRARRPRP